MVTIKIKTDNVAFHDEDYGAEVARILRDLATNLDGFGFSNCKQFNNTNLRDINGNTCGSVSIK